MFSFIYLWYMQRAGKYWSFYYPKKFYFFADQTLFLRKKQQLYDCQDYLVVINMILGSQYFSDLSFNVMKIQPTLACCDGKFYPQIPTYIIAYFPQNFKSIILIGALLLLKIIMSIGKVVFFHKKLLKQTIRSVKLYRSLGNSTFYLLRREIIEERYKPFKNLFEEGKIRHEKLECFEYLLCKYFKIPHEELFLNEAKHSWQNAKSSTLNYINDFLIKQLSVQKSEIPPQSINIPSHVLFQNFQISCLGNEQLIIADQNIWSQENSHSLTKLLCQLMNKSRFGGAAYMGIGNDLRVRGIYLLQTEKDNIRKLLHEARNSIFPYSPDYKSEQIFDVEFIKVKSFERNHDEATKSEKFVVKIFVNTNGNNKAYFIKEADANKKQKYIFVANHKLETDQAQWINNLQHQFRFKPELNYLKKMITYKKFHFETLLGQTINKKKDKQLKKNFGKEPQKRFQYESIIIITNNQQGIKIFQQFLNIIGDEKKFLHYHQVYDKLPKLTNSRRVYYMSHDKKPDQLGQFVLKLDNERRFIIHCKVKPQLSLLRNETFTRAIEILSPRFKDFTDQKYEVVWKLNIYGLIQYFIKFESCQSAIFAMVLLQYNDIRTNFANPKKMQKSFGIKYMKNLQKFKSTFQKIEPYLEQTASGALQFMYNQIN